MHCDSCESYIKTLLSPLSLESLSVDHKKRTLSYSLRDNLDIVSRESLVRTIRRALYTAGYEAEDTYNVSQTRSPGRRLYEFFFGGRYARRRRHLRHCSVCRQEGSEKPHNTASPTPMLQGVLIDDPSKVQVQETRLSIEGMTCSYVLMMSRHVARSTKSDISYSVLARQRSLESSQKNLESLMQ